MKFKTYEENGKTFIERLVYPHFKAEITFGEFSDPENIKMIDECHDAMDFAKAIGWFERFFRS